MKQVLIRTSLLISLVLFSCKKDDPKYLEPGAPVVQNYDITVYPSQWSYNSLYEQHFFQHFMSVDPNSAIYGYVMSSNGKQAIPYYSCTSFWCEQFDIANTLYSGYVEFQFTNYNVRTEPPTGEKYFYLVVVPPTLLSKNPNVNWENYEEVKSIFNLGKPIKLR